MVEDIEQAIAQAADHLRSGRPRAAQAICRGLLPDHATWQVHHVLAQSAAALGEREAALTHLRHALALNPASWQLHDALGMALVRMGRPIEAAVTFREALCLKPYDARILTNLANSLKSQGQLDEAVALYERAIEVEPHFAGAYNSLGQALELQGRSAEAAQRCRDALALDPDLAQAKVNLGLALQSLGDFPAALRCYQDAGSKLPALAAYNSAVLLAQAARTTEAVASARRAVQCASADARLHSYLLYLLQHDPRCDRRSLADEHVAWAAKHADHLYPRAKPYAHDRAPARRVRVGYVSPDFRSHAVVAFLEPILKGHNRSEFEVICYSHVRSPDAVTARLQSCVDNWRDIFSVSDEQAAQQIASDRVDILVDVCGHMRDNRLLIFARKPAPIQASYFTYPGTTGLKTIDYRITDSFQDPAGADGFYSERLIRLPEVAWCYTPWAELPVADPPVLRNGYVTFGSLNDPVKLNEEVIATWARILQNVAGSKLLLRGGVAGGYPNWIAEAFKRHGVPSERLELVGKQRLDGYLTTLDRIDIALDPFPYNGHTTSCDTLWAGVPLIALAGERAASRIGFSILSALGMHGMVAPNVAAYVQTATAIAGDFQQLAAMRRSLREQMRSAALMDYPARVVDIENAYRTMWRQWCDS